MQYRYQTAFFRSLVSPPAAHERTDRQARATASDGTDAHRGTGDRTHKNHFPPGNV